MSRVILRLTWILNDVSATLLFRAKTISHKKDVVERSGSFNNIFQTRKKVLFNRKEAFWVKIGVNWFSAAVSISTETTHFSVGGRCPQKSWSYLGKLLLKADYISYSATPPPSSLSIRSLISNNKNKEVEEAEKKKGKQMAFMALNFCVLSIFRYSSSATTGNLLTLEMAEKVSLLLLSVESFPFFTFGFFLTFSESFLIAYQFKRC